MTTVQNPNLTPRHGGLNTTEPKSLAGFASLREAFRRQPPLATLTLTLTQRIQILLLAFMLLTGCESSTPPPERSEPPQQSQLAHQATAASYPLAYFTKRLVGDSVEVLTLAPLNNSTNAWRPSRAEILSMQQSDIIFVNGTAAPFATWLPHVTLPDSKICPTANDGLALTDMIAVEDIRIVHSHGPEGEHSHPTMVAYAWLDPAMAAKQVGIMANRLTATYPNLKSAIAQAERELVNELAALSASIDEIRTQSKNPINVLTDSPDLKFLTRALGLNDTHLDWQEPPSALEAELQLNEKQTTATQRPKFMLFANKPMGELRSAIESLDLKVIEVNKMASEPKGSDYFDVMSENLNRLKPVFGIAPDPPKPNVSDLEQN